MSVDVDTVEILVPGIQGPIGPPPRHAWDGSVLSLERPNGTFAPGVDLLGPQGLSAYQVAVANGFQGSVEEWLESLQAGRVIDHFEVTTAGHLFIFYSDGSSQDAGALPQAVVSDQTFTGSPLSIAKGGTGANTAQLARQSLELGSAALAAAGDFASSGNALVGSLRFNRSFAISGSDLNQLLMGGFYDGSGLTNAPTNTNWWYVEVQTHSNGPLWCRQIASSLDQTGTVASDVYVRTRNNGTWGPWIRQLTGTDLATVNGLLAAKLDKAGGRLTGALSSAIVSHGVKGSVTEAFAYAAGNTHTVTCNGALTINPTGLAEGDVMQVNILYQSGSIAVAGTTQWELGGGEKSAAIGDVGMTLIAGAAYRIIFEIVAGVRTGVFQ